MQINEASESLQALAATIDPLAVGEASDALFDGEDLSMNQAVDAGIQVGYDLCRAIARRHGRKAKKVDYQVWRIEIDPDQAAFFVAEDESEIFEKLDELTKGKPNEDEE